MSQCEKNGTFKKYFTENMEALNLHVPSFLFDDVKTAIENATVLLQTIATVGPRATISEVMKKTTGLEKLILLSGAGPAFYVGAVIGSIAVASAKTMDCRVSLQDISRFLEQHNLTFDGCQHFYFFNPEILDESMPSRNTFASKAMLQGLCA